MLPAGSSDVVDPLAAIRSGKAADLFSLSNFEPVLIFSFRFLAGFAGSLWSVHKGRDEKVVTKSTGV